MPCTQEWKWRELAQPLEPEGRLQPLEPEGLLVVYFICSPRTVGYCRHNLCVCVCVHACVGVNLGTVGVLGGRSCSRVAQSKASDGQV